MADWPFAPLAYDMIVADPPWSFDNYSAAGEAKNAKAQYRCMSLDDIKGLPVGHLARGDALLMLWATNPMLDIAFDVLRSWGSRFKTAATWIKGTKGGHLAFGTGYILRGANEPILLGTIGSPKTSRSCRTVIEGLAREHSRKPDEAYEWAERLMPHARRVDLFSRQSRPGGRPGAWRSASSTRCRHE
jgi:N6-adenosine-specific RNA methylase IME4